MRISEFVSQKIMSEKLEKDDKSLVKNSKAKGEKNLNFSQISKDLVNVKSLNNEELTKINNVQNLFMRNEIIIKGLNRVKEEIENFENNNSNNFEKLVSKIQSILAETKYNGEQVISYLNSKINDQKSFYTFKMQLNKEIENVTLNRNKERNLLAEYLIKNENREALSNFNPDETIENIKENMKNIKIDNLYKDLSRISILINS